MTSRPEISIPTASTCTTSKKPYTIYNITLRLPLRTFTLQKRYSDFIALHSALTSQAGGSPPPVSPPPKSYFTSTTSSPALAESRRQALESYLQTINTDPDGRWRNTTAWRSFLNLPSSSTSSSNNNSRHTLLQSSVNGGATSGQPVADPVAWLDHHRHLKSTLHAARLELTKRDQASTAQAQHECSAQAKKCLVQAGTTISSLEQGLKTLGTDSSSSWGSEKNKLGEGEMRRRRDLVASAKKEKEGLENLLNAMVAKSSLDATIAQASMASKEKLLLDGSKKQAPPPTGRVLGKETDRTRALDNHGVLQLQQQLMREQDEDVDVLAQAVRRQRQIAGEIQEELVVQKDLLGMLDEDVDRVKGKVDVARKRVAKIS
ncbi:MAG: hypothetical protein LQ338_003982 [Usnochroma carphineum]|nr:MAG: hypothetical protein LQ338_003982 [Usnochroma carphineum]